MLTPEQIRFRNEAVLRNLRFRYPNFSNIGDTTLIELYEDFAVSELYGNNDEHFEQYVRDCLE